MTILPFSLTTGFVASTGSNFVMSWQSVSGLTCQVVGSLAPDASLNTWTNIGAPVPASGGRRYSTPATCAGAEARYLACVKFILALFVYLLMAVLFGWSMLEAVHGHYGLLGASLLVYCFAFGKLGCLPSKGHG